MASKNFPYYFEISEFQSHSYRFSLTASFFAKMSAFRSLRLAAFQGVKTLNGNRVNQRKFVALALTSLSQVKSKKICPFLNERVNPVNKYDLSGFSVLTSNQSALLSTAKLDTVPDEISENVEDEKESVRTTKWPTPKLNQNNQRIFAGHQVFIGSKSFKCDEDYLQKLFSQFGPVRSVTIPEKERYLSESHVAENEYRWGFVSFTTKEGMINALNAGSLKLDEINKIEIKQKNKRGLVQDEYKSTLMITDLPVSTSVTDIKNLFQPFGAVFVNYIYNSTTKITGKLVNFAFVVFKNEECMSKALEAEHSINSFKIVAKKLAPGSKVQPRDRCFKVCLQGIPFAERTEEAIRKYFADAKKVYLVLDNVTKVPNGNAIVELASQEAAHEAEEKNIEIAGKLISVKALGWSDK